MPLAAEDLSLLVLVVDVNPFFWAQRPPSLPTFHDFLSQLRVFLNAYLLLHSANKAAVIATGYSSCAFVHPTPPVASSSSSSTSAPPSTSSPAEDAIAQLLSFAAAEAERAKGESSSSSAAAAATGIVREQASLLSGSLSMALAYCVKASSKGSSAPRPRILCIHGSPDAAQQYVAIMNAIFSSQKAGVPIDACAIGASDSAFLQQAAFLTGGLYLHSTRPNALLQDLLLVFGVDQFSRDFITLPQPSAVDFRASCFCHKQPVDLGFVCSVCLSIFCAPARTCATCGADFASAKRTRVNPPQQQQPQ
ncbi:hypothetical protein CLOM_g10124 [Closterium sp. NIES-68]|nr:hypothetical protein CLOM_g10124 [Closterium sp. NIES-68]GJP50971.1 hypothetical protein CLOM_g10124 [Closterium sp. NIES-68]